MHPDTDNREKSVNEEKKFLFFQFVRRNHFCDHWFFIQVY